MTTFIKKYWFFVGLIAVLAITLVDHSRTVSGAGIWIKGHHGPALTIFMIFLLSGMAVDIRQAKAGARDMQGTLLALALILIIAPLLGAAFVLLPLPAGLAIGILLVAVMPTTLSSGVVMTGMAGGNTAHALLITIVANVAAIFTIPMCLGVLLKLVGTEAVIAFDRLAIMIKLGKLVLMPLALGMALQWLFGNRLDRITAACQTANQIFILGIVWMALAPARQVILDSGHGLVLVTGSAVVYHGLLLLIAVAATRLLTIGAGRRESIFFMGGQKTLPLSIILQVTLFPQYGIALVYCVLHHIAHLMMDGYLAGRLAPVKRPSSPAQ